MAQPSAPDEQSAAAPSAAKRAPRTTTPRASGTAKRPSAARTTTGADPTDATGAKKTTATRSTGSRTTAAKTGTARTTAAKTGTARTTAAKRTPAKAAPETDPSIATPASPDDGSTPAVPASTPRAPRTTTRTTGASSGTKTPAAKTGTSRTTAAKSTTTRTPAKRTPARSGTARTTTPKPNEQTAAASAGVLDEVRAPVVGDTSAPAAEPGSTPDVDTTVTPTESDRVDGSTAASEPTTATTVDPVTAPETAATTTTEDPRPTVESARTEPASDVQAAQPSVAAPPVAPKRPVARPTTTKPPSTPAESPAAGKGADTAAPEANPIVLSISGLVKQFGDTVAVDGVDLEVRRGSFYGIVGPNGAGKTTTLSMVTGLLRPDAGSIRVQGVDVWQDPAEAKRAIGVLPDRLRLFDRLTGNQLLYYSGVLRGLDPATVKSRTTDLARAFGLDDALGRLVSDYSAGMTKKIALAAALIHSPRLLILDEPFESVDPVSAANVIEILQRYVANGGTVVLSSHGMDFIQRVCDHVAIIVQGKVLAAGSVDEVRGTGTLEERFVELAGGRKSAEGMEWLHSFSD